MEKFFTGLLIIIIVLVLAFGVVTSCTPIGRGLWNQYQTGLRQVDDRTTYEKLKLVEDTARAMISSYESDKLTYEQFKDLENTEKQSWAEQAKMRANKTASTYNNYILQNSFVWKDNVPNDIYRELQFIK